MENNNESFQLLGLSGSDTGSEISEFVLTPKRKKLKRRRYRGSSSARVEHPPKSCRCRAQTLALTIAVTLLICWLIVITWLAVVLHGEVRRLDTNVRAVAAGSQGVPDALQKCHSVSRELQQNQTALYNRLAALSLQVGNFSVQLTGLHNGLNDVEERLKAAPELVNVPQNLKDLSASVASFGSQISDLDATVKSLKDQATKLHDTSDVLVANVSGLQVSLGQVMNTSQRPDEASAQHDKEENNGILSAIAQLTANVSLVNSTLVSKLAWLKEDQQKDHSLIEVLQNVGQNVTARVTTVEEQCAKQTAQELLGATVKKLADNVTASSARVSDLGSKLAQLQSQYNKLDEKSEVAKTTPLQPVVTLLPTPTPTSSPQPPALDVTSKPAPAPKPPVTRP